MTGHGAGPSLTPDFRDLLIEFADAGVEFLVIGGHALARHGYIRATLDLDVLVRPSKSNADRVVAALNRFGAPLAAHGVTRADFEKVGTVYQIGLPPSRVDVLTSISGVAFEDAWTTRVQGTLNGRAIAYIGRDALIRNKRAAGRPKDLVDASELERRPGPAESD